MTTLNSKSITDEILKKIEEYQPSSEKSAVGKILTLADGVAMVSGLSGASYAEMLEFPYGIFGVAINLEEDAIGVIILGDYLKLREGDEVKATGKLLSIPVGNEFIGRVVNPLGQPLDGRGRVLTNKLYPLEKTRRCTRCRKKKARTTPSKG